MIPVVHVGYCKTATTTLQDCLYANHSEIYYLGKQYKNREFHTMVRCIHELDSVKFPLNFYQDLITTEYKNSCGKVLMLSDEAILGAFNAGLALERIKKLFGEVKIIITIREQLSLLSSMYSNQRYIFRELPTGHEFPITITEWLEYNYSKNGHYFLGSLCYDEYIAYARHIFGAENVGVFLYEDMKNNKSLFIEQLCNFIGISDINEANSLLSNQKKNASRSNRHRSLESFRLNNKKLWKLMKSLPIPKHCVGKFVRAGVNKATPIPEEWKVKLINLYAVGNKKVQIDYQLPLSENNYHIEQL